MAKILVVDDNAASRKLVAALLSHEGHEVLDAADAAEGLTKARAQIPQLIISDILMPSMDGYEFVRRIRADPAISDVGVIFYTAYYHQHAAFQLAATLGVARVIVKPCPAAEFIDAVTHALKNTPQPHSVPHQEFEHQHVGLVNDMLARKTEELRSTTARLEALTELNTQLASEREPRVLLEKVCHGARDLLGARYAVLAVIERESGEAQVLATSGLGPDAAPDAHIRVDGGLMGQVAGDRQTVRMGPGMGPAALRQLPAGLPPATAILAAPLASLSQSFGWILLADKIGATEFDPADERILAIIGAQAGRVYENSRLYAELQLHATQLMTEMAERERAAAQLQHSEQRFRVLAESIQDAFFVVERDLRQVSYMSPAYAGIWGRSAPANAHQPVPWRDCVHAEDIARIELESAWQDAQIAPNTELQFRIIRPDSTVRWVSVRIFPVAGTAAPDLSIVGVATDITDRKLAQARIGQLNRVHAMLSGINSLIIRVTHRLELFREVCRLAVEQGGFAEAWCGWLDASTGRLLPMSWAGAGFSSGGLAKFAIDGAAESPTIVAAAIRRGAPAICNELADCDRSIRIYAQMVQLGYHSAIALPLLIDARPVGCLLLATREREFFDAAEERLLTELAGDISFALDHIGKTERINYLAYYDSLTGLANRTFFLERLSQHIQASVREGRSFALVMADPERFDSVNETFGRYRGDEVLKRLAADLERCVGESNAVGRLGADQFGLLLFDVPDAQSGRDIVDRLMQQWLVRPITIDGVEIRIAVKAGVALFPADGVDAEALMKRAEAALKGAKASGERLLFYAPHLSSRAAEDLALENQLRLALDRDQFVLHYQPKVDAQSRKLIGVEALMRWRHPELGLVPPLKFIPFLEETGMIVEVGAWALRQASLDRSRWLERRLVAPRVAVNVSTIQLRRPDFVRTVSTIVKLAGNEAGIDLEVTESLIMEDAQGNIEKLKSISDLGVGIAIDDFGTGYSSLGYLTKLPADTLKIDRSFVATMLEDPAAMTLVSTIISLAHSLKMVVVAEGVESEEQAKLLRLVRCDQLQGFLISKALSFDDMISFMARTPGERR